MRLSIWPSAAQPYTDILEVARHAADTGWDGVYIADHFMPNLPAGEQPTTPMLEAGSLAAALGAAIPRVRIGTLVYGNTYRHPAVLANMAATVDHITGGRFVFGVGAGWQINEHHQYGIELPPVKQLLDRFVEALQVWHGLLRTPTTTFTGNYYQLTDAVCEPKPIQDPMPILIGAKGEKRMLKVVAEHADLWNTWGLPDVIAHKSRILDRYCTELGRDPRTIGRTAQAAVVVDGPLPDNATFPVYGGSTSEIARTVDGYREIGLDELIIPDGLLGTGPQRLKALDTIQAVVRT
ncbi:LLM class flavin-dependent oxidoreductase [Actinoplanes sp. NPDC049802]|uniref:LLM class flavin-dependent oxidoreductase n=1 Tax=Actinoplanes sp. NPDC049802 TaxID=3154742 RepID=UPI0033F7A7C8